MSSNEIRSLSKSEIHDRYRSFPKHILRNIINDILVKSRGADKAKFAKVLKPKEVRILFEEMEGTD